MKTSTPSTLTHRIVTRDYKTQAIIGYAYGASAKEAEQNDEFDGIKSYSLLKDENYSPVNKREFYN